MAVIAKEEPLSKRMLAFLGIIEYFNETELSHLKKDLESWEHRVEWERLKDRADNLVSRGDPAKALPLYARALKYEENAPLLNNMAIASMQLANHGQAVSLLAKAHAIEPNNPAITLHYAEAAILNRDYEKAELLLRKTEEAIPGNADTAFLRGTMAYQQENYPLALSWLEKAKTICTKATQAENTTNRALLYQCTHKLAETYVKMSQQDKALAALDQNDPNYHIKMAEIYAQNGHVHMPDAIRHTKEAIAKGGHNATALWTKLAMYYRMDFDWQRAGEAIANALPSESEATLLENARIQKGLGRMRDYRAGLLEVLSKLKKRYRAGE